MFDVSGTIAEITGRKVNHSTRKTFASTLLHADSQITEVAQLGGWKSVATLTNYNVPSLKQQNKASTQWQGYYFYVLFDR
jgi:integrase